MLVILVLGGAILAKKIQSLYQRTQDSEVRPVSRVGELAVLQHGEPRDIRTLNLQGPGLPPSSTSIKVSTVERSAGPRTRYRWPEYQFGGGAQRRRAGEIATAPGVGKGQMFCLIEGLCCYRAVTVMPVLHRRQAMSAMRRARGVLQRRGAEEERGTHVTVP